MKTTLAITEFYLAKCDGGKATFEGCRVRLTSDDDFQAADTPQVLYPEDGQPTWVYFAEAASLCEWLAVKTGQSEGALRDFVENCVAYGDE